MLRILFLAGGYDQKIFILGLRQRGHYVILVDYTEQPMALEDSDKFYQISTLDVESVLQIAVKENVDLVLTACTDQALLTMAYVSEKLGLPCYLNYETARMVTNKVYMKQRMMAYNIPTPLSLFISKNDTAIKSNINYPVIVKPCDCNSSKGVILASNEFEMYNALQEALILSRDGNALIEEYKIGREISADLWIFDDNAQLLGISESKKIKNKDKFIIYKSEYINNVSVLLRDKIKGIGLQIAKAFQLNNIPLLIQLIENRGELNVIEFSARIGGGTKYKFIEYMSGIDIVNKFLDMVLKGECEHNSVELQNKQIELNYLYVYKGVFSSISGVEELIKKNIIKEWFQYKRLGSEVSKVETSGDRVAGMLLVGNDLQELSYKRGKSLSRLSVYDEANKDILIRDIFR